MVFLFLNSFSRWGGEGKVWKLLKGIWGGEVRDEDFRSYWQCGREWYTRGLLAISLVISRTLKQSTERLVLDRLIAAGLMRLMLNGILCFRAYLRGQRAFLCGMGTYMFPTIWPTYPPTFWVTWSSNSSSVTTKCFQEGYFKPEDKGLFFCYTIATCAGRKNFSICDPKDAYIYFPSPANYPHSTRVV